jgi:predicted transcriptional regulator
MAGSSDTIMSLTAQIVSAHIAKNNVDADRLPDLIRDVYRTLASMGEPPAESSKPKAAVTPAKSVFADYIVCLEDGKKMKMLKRHLMTDHKLTPDQYRARWGLPPTYPMVAASYAKTRSVLAKKIGLGQKRTVARKGGRKRAGSKA